MLITKQLDRHLHVRTCGIHTQQLHGPPPHALKEAGFNVFIDDEELEKGEDITAELVFRLKKKTAELVQAILGSRISVIVFSRRYAASSWCLEELVKIMECKRTLGQMVFPIFYDVDPSDVRKQTGWFGEAFVKHEDRFLLDTDKVQRWRSALTEAATLSGWDLRSTADGWIKFSRERYELPFYVGLDDVRMIRILGTGGMGKSFLANVSETAKQPNGLAHLQEQLLSDILKPTKLKVDTIDRRINVIKERLPRKRVLVIIDDIDRLDQLNAIAGNRDWFGLGGRIIVTRRDERLLNQLEVDAIHLAPVMNEAEALELFSWHAFKNSYPHEEYYELSKSVVAYCGGLPLALEKHTRVGKCFVEIEKNSSSPNSGIRMSFDGLNDDNERNIFLDGTKKVGGLILNVPSSEKVSFSADAFTKMLRLRFLQLNYVQLTGAYKYISKELRRLCWHGFPLKFIPNDFDQQNLVAIDLQYSNLTHLQKDAGVLVKLKILNLSHFHGLTQ
ncbi:Disease resistance protein TIR-NBS-LRR class family [Prunus dulcis]|uniref:Disease resistance protein TIR-NBS-LRR class family n=1 Tax=Prunus dulcis TaxID=3755 RepID=A0A4Y1RGE7_PRUDU|nr:Disease resistance protein TIR-NBS-LRR class family [Prunus dulcis]